MKLGLSLGYWTGEPPAGVPEALAEAERLGLDSVWTSEAYGSDAFTPLAWWGSRTSRLRLGTSVAQMAARTPAATAMAAMTLDHLSKGRFVLGLGVSGPQVVEGWHGQPFNRPLARTREYVEIVRRVIARQQALDFHGEFFDLPLGGGTGLGRALKSTVYPLRRDLPIFLAAQSPRNVALAAEIADGWLPWLYSPRHDSHYRAALIEGFGRPGARRAPEDFEVAALVPFVIADDVEMAADAVRPLLALYVGGMGARGRNFHFNVVARMGYEGPATRVQDLYLAGRRREAQAAIPTGLVEEVALIGPREKIREELPDWRRSLITTLLVQAPADQLLPIAELVLG